jgi:hypothetical protein
MLNRTFFAFVLAAFVGFAAMAQDLAVVAEGDEVEATTDATALSVIERWEADPTTIFEADDIVLADLQFVARPVIVFADSPSQPAFIEQIRLIEADLSAMAIRDVILIVDTDPDDRSDLRRELRPRGFSLVLIDKDGRVSLRKAEPWSTRELSRQIDKMPLRQQEIRERLGSP